MRFHFPWSHKAQDAVSSPLEPELLRLKELTDRLQTQIDSWDEMRRKVTRIEKLVYRHRGDNHVEQSDDPLDVSWLEKN